VLRVGLTGNMAAGKSVVADCWRRLGATVVDADLLARRAVEPGTPALAAIAEAWGPAVLAAGELDRAALRRIVFTDPDALARLERIVHPAIASLRDQAFREAALRGEPLAVADVPLLFETGMTDEFDVIVLVDAPEALRLERAVRDRGLDPEEARRMMSAQMPSELKRAGADHVLTNTGTLGDLEDRARSLWRTLRERALGDA
jgi:dephospho-CoA kinase